MDERHRESSALQSFRRGLAAVLIGLACSMAIWVVTPYNNFIMASSYIADSYLPVAALALTLVLVLVVNPLLRAIRPSLSLSGRQLAVIVGLMLVACVVPSSGLLRMLPYSIANVPLRVSQDSTLAGVFKKMDLPSVLFPDKLEHGADVPVSEYFVGELPAGEKIPWGAWAGPLKSWGVFLLCGWLMMIGLSMIVLPQWRRNERLAFPLVTVQQHLIEPPEAGQLFGPLFRKKSFWVAALGVLTLHVLLGLQAYYPDSVPAIPLRWDLSSLFTELPWSNIGSAIRTSRLYFVFFGVAFFMPNRISFSLWFTTVAYAVWAMIGTTYFPPFREDTLFEQRDGAMVAFTLAILYVGRAHWARVFGALFRRVQGEQDRHHRYCAALFLVGLAGMFCWLLWTGVKASWAAMFVAFAFMVVLVITRIIAETGIPHIRLIGDPLSFMKLAPLAWLKSALPSVYMAAVVGILYTIASRVNTGVMATHALALDESAGPRRRSRMGTLFIGLLAAGVLIAGVMHLRGNYRYTSTLDNRAAIIDEWGTNLLNPANEEVKNLDAGRLNRPVYNRWIHLGIGAGLATGLYWACLTMPRWPLHPVGLLMLSQYGRTMWASIFLGWLTKIVLVRYGGSRLYQLARPFFLGVIMGEVFATVVWAIVPAILVALDLPYKMIEILPT